MFSRIKGSNLYHKIFIGTPWRGVYPTFKAAREAISASRIVGYDSEPAAESARLHPVYRERTTDYVAMFHLQPILKENVRVVDLGGSMGMFYYVYQRYLSFPQGTEWLICDVPKIVAVAKEIAAKKRDGGYMRVTSDFKDAEGCSILHSAGALQFIEEPLAELIGSLKQKPTYLLINRIPTWEADPLYTVHHIREFSCAYQIFNEKQFVDSLTAIGYELVDKWECPESSFSVRFKPHLRLNCYHGFYFALPGAPVPSIKKDFDPSL